MKDEKKPCPFCGRSEALVLGPTCNKVTPYDPSNRAFPLVRCWCGAEVPGDNWDTSGKTAIAAWNRRAPDARDARIAELEAELAAEPRATDAPTAVAAADPQLLKFYGAASDAELIAAQAAHIKRLQAKLPPAPSFAPQRVREG